MNGVEDMVAIGCGRSNDVKVDDSESIIRNY